MTLTDIIKAHFTDSITVKQQTLETVSPAIIQAAHNIMTCLSRRGKVLACGNGGSAADAQHFSGEMLGRLERERCALPAIALTTDTSALTAIANDQSFTEVFSRQVQALGNTGDILLAISTSGNSASILAAIETAHSCGLSVIALSGHDGGAMAGLLSENDIEIRVCATRTMRIQEAHILIIHCICDLVDRLLLAKEI
jgi:D-sedoheptulose 7-phosphate isomerase